MSFENKDQWRQEYKCLKDCRAAFDSDDLHVAFEAGRPQLENYLKGVMSQFGERRVNMVLGHSIRGRSWDGRFYDSVKAWAERQPPFEQSPRVQRDNLPDRDYHELITEAHSTIVNETCLVKMQMEKDKARTEKNMNRGEAR